MSVQIVTVPYRYDDFQDGLGQGPRALLRAGLESRLKKQGVELAETVETRLPDEERQPSPVAANIGRLGNHTAENVAAALNANNHVLVLAGDDTAVIGVVSGVQHGCEDKRIGLVWLDAHTDFNTPETSMSGILAGMPVAILAGLAGPIWRGSANLRHPIPTDQILIAGVRAIDQQENQLVSSTSLRIVRADTPGRSAVYTDAVARLMERVDIVVVNVDLDILDPLYVPSASTPEAKGLTPRQVAWMIDEVTKHGKTAVISITSLNPGARQRGEKSVTSTLQILEQSIPAWAEKARDQPTCE